MENEITFRILLPIVLISFVLHRGWQTSKRTPEEKRVAAKLDAQTGSRAISLLALIAMLSSLIYIVMPQWLSWAALPLPAWLRWLSLLLALSGFALLEWAQTALGKNWSDTPVKLKDHTLAAGGPYHYVRHPIYTAFIVILSTPLLISANWLVGLAWMGMAFLDVSARASSEEKMLRETFGEKYQALEKRTGRFFPRILAKH